MDFFQALAGGDLQMTDPMDTLGAALTQASPQPSQVPQQMPQRGQPNLEMQTPLTLLRLATLASQPRMMNESKLSHALKALSGAAHYGSNLRASAEADVEKRYATDMKAAELQSQIRNQETLRRGSEQAQRIQAAKAPLEIEGLKQAIESNRDTAQLNQIKLKMEKARSVFADQLAKAEMDLANAKVEDERQQAKTRIMTAQAGLKNAEAHMISANAQAGKLALEKQILDEGKKLGEFKTTEPDLATGTPGRFVYKAGDGTIMQGDMPLDQVSAIKKAKADWKELKDMFPGQNEQEWIRDRTMAYVAPKDFLAAKAHMESVYSKKAQKSGAPALPGQAGTGATPGGPATPAGNDEVTKALIYSRSNPGMGQKHLIDGVVRYFLGGKEVDEATYLARKAPPTSPTGATEVQQVNPEIGF